MQRWDFKNRTILHNFEKNIHNSHILCEATIKYKLKTKIMMARCRLQILVYGLTPKSSQKVNFHILFNLKKCIFVC